MSLYDLRISSVEMQTQIKELRPAAPAFPYFGEWSEYVSGGWQRNLAPLSTDSAVRFSAVFRCITLISGDTAKLRPMLMEQQNDGTKREVGDGSPYLQVLRRPNHYQTWQQFVEEWQKSKQTAGNTYVLLERDNRGGEHRGVPTAMYVLDPLRTTPLVADNGSVFYRLGKDRLARIGEDDPIVPASEIIHDRGICFWHPLVGVSPLYAAAASALLGTKIGENSANFFANASRPSGMLIYPQKIDKDQATKVKEQFESGFGGANIGRFAVLGGDVKYLPLTIPAVDAQLAEQASLSIADVARAYGVPPYKLGLQTNVTFNNAGQLNQDYYSQCLQVHIFAMQAVLRDGLGLPSKYRIWLNLDDLLIMDSTGQADADAKELGSGSLSPNEARLKRNRPPVKGGELPYMQQQMWQIGQLAERTAPSDAPQPPPEPEEPAAANEEDAEGEKQFSTFLHGGFAHAELTRYLG